MTASAKPAKRRPEAQNEDPAKGGTDPAHEKAYPSGDSPKPHGDKFGHAVEPDKSKKTS
jgi:hypothetical protein